VFLLSFGSANAANAPAAQSIIHGLDYLAVDYPSVISNGDIVNAGEYAEQKEIAAHTMSQLQSLPASSEKSTLLQLMADIQQAINNKVAGEQVVKLSRKMATIVMATYDVELAPTRTPDLAKGQQLFQTHCASCHGVNGFGDGPMAKELEPAPANFHDKERQEQRSLLGLFNTISLGVDGTAMRAFTELSAEQRWDLAFYVSNFASSEADLAAGERVKKQGKQQQLFPDLQSLTKLTMQDARKLAGEEGAQLMAYLRQNPDLIQNSPLAPLDISLTHLRESLSQYQAGHHKDAYKSAVAAYLEGFELVERRLDTVAPELRTNIEKQLMAYRTLLKKSGVSEQVKNQYQAITGLMEEARQQLQKKVTTASPGVSFFAAALILLREGLEAILVLAAIIALLAKMQRRDAIRYIHIGWVSALVLGGLTWLVSEHLIPISGAHREITEGATALIAAAMLLYVGFWLHNQAHSKRWQQYIRSKITSNLNQSTFWGLSFIAFMAVYREVFETILFYRSMWLSADTSEHSYMVFGIVIAAAALVILAWLIMKFSVRLPLKQFFKINTVLMFVLAVIFAGKGIAALQEAGVFPYNPVNFFRIDLLGIYPNLESLGVQLLLVLGVGLWWLKSYLRDRRLDSVKV
jgi:high-affinity iron transporter